MPFIIKNRWHRNYLIRRYLYGPFLNFGMHLLSAFKKVLPLSLFHLDRPIFIIGCSRSGTTIFMDWFNKHADLCNWSEAAQVMELKFYNESIDHVKNENDANPFEIFRISFLFGIKTRLTQKKRFVNKHPENSFRIKFIRKIFPDALFVHVIRDGRAVAASNELRRQIDPFRTNWPFGQFPKPPDWRDYLSMPHAEQFARQWVDTITYIRDFAANELTSQSYLEIFYEDFCNDPFKIISRIDEFCGLDPKRRTFENTEPLENKNFHWNSRISSEQAKTIEKIVSPLNSELGYDENGCRPDSQKLKSKVV